MTVGFEVISALAGGSYWSHYLIQMVAPLAVLVGVAAARGSDVRRVVLVASTVVCAVAWTVAFPWQTSSLAGERRARPSVLSLPRTTPSSRSTATPTSTSAAGLSSPYPYLWSLPTKTRDPQLRELADVLSGPQAPTWFVTWSHLSSWGVDSSAASRLLANRYHPVAHLHGHTIYLRNGVDRRAPDLRGPVPRTPPLITTALKEHLP